LGAAVKSEGPYRYLPDSLKALPSRAEIVAAMVRAGFTRVAAPTQSLGIVTTFLGEAAGPPPSSVGARG
jgi:ubiquinone/menaquinone biosynthesis C-methylase UbiE